MKIKPRKKIVGPMRIKEYLINHNFTGSLIELNGEHGMMKSLTEDRLYFVIEGKGKFIINGKSEQANPEDLFFISKNTPYNIIGKMKYFLVCSPEFHPENDIFFDRRIN